MPEKSIGNTNKNAASPKKGLQRRFVASQKGFEPPTFRLGVGTGVFATHDLFRNFAIFGNICHFITVIVFLFDGMYSTIRGILLASLRKIDVWLIFRFIFADTAIWFGCLRHTITFVPSLPSELSFKTESYQTLYLLWNCFVSPGAISVRVAASASFRTSQILKFDIIYITLAVCHRPPA